MNGSDMQNATILTDEYRVDLIAGLLIEIVCEELCSEG